MNRVILMTLAVCAAMVVSASAADAKANWEKDCKKCHGPEGKGDTAIGKKLEIKDFSDPKVQASLKDEAMFKAIKEGVKQGDRTRMKAAQGLSDDEIKALVAYVRAFKK